jgi:hypothetical protein
VPLVFVENGFCALTGNLLVSDTIVCLHVERRMSSNLEMYFECNISERNIKLIGRMMPGLSLEEFYNKK